MNPQKLDLVVVGAGMSGIAAARFYLEIHPTCQLVILEQEECLGGVWSSKRSYKHFWTQWTVGTAEWSDMRMHRPPEGDLYYEFFKAEHTTKYLEEYASSHQFAGQTLRDRIRFGYKVKKIEKMDLVWIITSDKGIFNASKAIIAGGLTSDPTKPKLLGAENFKGSSIHQKEFGESDVLTDNKLQNVAVLGGGKSAADMVYACVKAGKSVSWIIRGFQGTDEGTGPAFFVSPKGGGPYKNASELSSTRFVATLSPSILNPNNWWTRFLHQTFLGRMIVNAVWNRADKGIRKGADYDGRPNALEGFRKLQPHTGLFWQNSGAGLLNRKDFWDTVAPNVKVFLDYIDKVDGKLIHLKQGGEIPIDVLLYGTGFKPASFNFFDSHELVRLGLPHPMKDEPPEEAEIWARLEKQADQGILKQFPMLANPPEHSHKYIETTPYRLYNGIAPLNDGSIVFIGYFLVANYFKGVECQAIWATAFLDKQLKLSSLEDRRAEIARFLAWCKRRYLSNGEYGNFVVFESNFYADRLLQQVGLTSHCKGFFRNYFVPGTSQDLAGLKDEYQAKYGASL